MSKTNESASPRAWQRMLSGRRLNLLDPSPLDVEITDIALGLSESLDGTDKPTVQNHIQLLNILFLSRDCLLKIHLRNTANGGWQPFFMTLLNML